MGLEKLPEILRSLHEEKVDCVVIGAVAMMVHGLVRGTEDLDFFVRPTEGNIERLRVALRRVYPGDGSIDEISEADLLGEYPAVRYNTPDGSFGIDILTRLGEAFSYEDLEYQDALFEGIPVRVATPETLFRMKKGTLRWKDRLDAEKLRERFDLKE